MRLIFLILFLIPGICGATLTPNYVPTVKNNNGPNGSAQLQNGSIYDTTGSGAPGSGLIGIGNTAPIYKVDISGGLRAGQLIANGSGIGKIFSPSGVEIDPNNSVNGSTMVPTFIISSNGDIATGTGTTLPGSYSVAFGVHGTTFLSYVPGGGYANELCYDQIGTNFACQYVNHTGDSILYFGPTTNIATAPTSPIYSVDYDTNTFKFYYAPVIPTNQVTTTQSATPTIAAANNTIYKITGLAQAITSMTTNFTLPSNDGDIIEIRITDNGTARAITWGSDFESTTVTLPTTTVISTEIKVFLQYNSTASKMDCIGVA